MITARGFCLDVNQGRNCLSRPRTNPLNRLPILITSRSAMSIASHLRMFVAQLRADALRTSGTHTLMSLATFFGELLPIENRPCTARREQIYRRQHQGPHESVACPIHEGSTLCLWNSLFFLPAVFKVGPRRACIAWNGKLRRTYRPTGTLPPAAPNVDCRRAPNAHADRGDCVGKLLRDARGLQAHRRPRVPSSILCCLASPRRRHPAPRAHRPRRCPRMVPITINTPLRKIDPIRR